jgi:hypothetical protein
MLVLALDEIKSMFIALVVLVMMIWLGQVFRYTCWCCRSCIQALLDSCLLDREYIYCSSFRQWLVKSEL